MKTFRVPLLIQLLSLTFFSLFIAFSTHADSHRWTGQGDGSSWSDPLNWDIGVPAHSDHVYFSNGDTITLGNITTRPTHVYIDSSTVVYLNDRFAIYGNFTLLSGLFDVNEQLMSIGGSLSVQGGSLYLSSVSFSLSTDFEISGGEVYSETSSLTFSNANLIITGGVIHQGEGTLLFTGDNDAELYASQSITFYHVIVNKDSFMGTFQFRGTGATVFSIEHALQIDNYDDYMVNGVSVSNASIHYLQGSELVYNRTLGIPATGDEWPASGLSKLVLAKGNVTVSGSKTGVDTVSVRGGQLFGSLAYTSTGSVLSYTPTTPQNLSIGDEWPSSNGPESVIINNSGYSVSGNTNYILRKSLTITDGTLDLNGHTLSILGTVSGSTLSGNGAFAEFTSLVLGNGTGINVTQTIAGALTLDDILINKADADTDANKSVLLSTPFQLRSGASLTIQHGTLDANGQTPILSGLNSLIVLDQFKTGGASINGFTTIDASSGHLVLNGTIPETLPVCSVSHLEIDNSEGVYISTGVTHILDTLTLTQGILTTTSTKVLRIGLNGIIQGVPSHSNYIEGPLQKAFDQADTFTFPLGSVSGFYPSTFTYSSFNSASESIVELSFSTQSFNPGTQLPEGISEVESGFHYILKEKGTTPSTYSYTLTLTYEDGVFLPETRNRILLQASATPTWIQMETDVLSDIDTDLNTVRMTGASVFPTDDGRVILGKGSRDVFFTGALDSNWFNAENWSEGSLPSTVDDVIISENQSIVLGDNDNNAGTETPLQTIASLTLESGASLEISVENTATTALMVGSGVGSDTVLFILEGSHLLINGGTVKSLALPNTSTEFMVVEGTLSLSAGTGLGSGTGGLALPISRLNFADSSLFEFGIEAAYFQAQNYGHLTLNLIDKLVINQSITILGNLTINSGTFAFIEGEISGVHAVVWQNLNINNDAYVRTCMPHTGFNTFTLHGDLNVEETAWFSSTAGMFVELASDQPQNLCASITELRKLKVSGAGVKTLSNDLVVWDSLIIGESVIDAGEHTITIGTGTDNIGAITYIVESVPTTRIKSNKEEVQGRAWGRILGRLMRWVPPGSIGGLNFPIESSSVLREVVLDFQNTGSGGIMFVEFNEQDPGKNGLTLVDFDGTHIEHIYSTGYWTITPLFGMSESIYDVQLVTENLVGVSNPSDLRIIKRSDGSQPWGVQGTHDYGEINSDGEFVIRRTGLSEFSDFAIGGSEDNPLPVELTEFKAIPSGNRVPTLVWTTATEKENYGFELYRSEAPTNALDSVTWKKLHFIEGAGTRMEETTYHYTDHTALLAGTYWYRLHQQDFDGKVDVYDPISISIDAPYHTSIESIYPNPFNPSTTISFTLNKTQSTQLDVYDILGRKVRTILQATLPAGTHHQPFDASGLSSGQYFIVLITDGRQWVQGMTLVQ